MEIYLVGGAVRDKLLGIESQDLDWVVVGAKPEEMLSQGYKVAGASFPVFIHPTTGDEYALARTERKTGLKHTDFESFFDVSVTLEDDLKRRDLTINAIAMDSNGGLIDPYGGVKDLRNRVLKHVSDSFGEDPLRILRVARFMARYSHLGFKVDEKTIFLMRDIGEQLVHITPERIWKELSRALLEKTPSAFFETLRACDCLQHILPEIDALWGVPQPVQHHPEVDTGVHTMMVLEQAASASDDVDVIFAALTHDLGKAVTDPSMWPSHHGHESLGIPLVNDLCNRLKVPASTKRLALIVCEYHTMAHKALELRPGKIVSMLYRLDAFRNHDTLNKFLVACECDSRGRLGREHVEYPQSTLLRNAFEAASKVTAKEFVEKGMSGEKIGEMIRAKRIHAVKSISPKRDDLNYE